MTAPESTVLAARATSSGLLAMRVEFAHAAGTRLLVYGWVAGLSEWVASAVLRAGESEFDILTEALHFARPDVTQNFRDQGLAGNEHGFLALLDTPELPSSVQTVRLQVYLNSGRAGESNWPILRDPTIAGATLRAHEGALRPLIPRLSPRQRRVLASFASTSRLSLRAEDLNEQSADGALGLPLHIQLCCLLPGGVIVVGGVLPRPVAESGALTLSWDALRLDLLPGLIRVNDLGTAPSAQAQEGDLAYLPSGFVFAARVPAGAPRSPAVRVQYACAQGSAVARPHPRAESAEAQAQLLAHLGSIDANARLELCERILGLLRASATTGEPRQPANEPPEALEQLLERQITSGVRELPEQIDVRGTAPVMMVVDRAIQVGKAGIFLVGWFHGGRGTRPRVFFRGKEFEFDVGQTWARWARPDVDSHLAVMGFAADDEPGFYCFVPYAGETATGYISVCIESGRSYRLRLPPTPVAPTPLAGIRDILGTVDPNRRDLRELLDRHVGPAVGALWASRAPALQRGFVEHFGPPCEAPACSIVVPLFGRHDFADVQLALFADDRDFQQVELIYVVDDPAIVREFHQACHDLYGIHRVPFVLAYPGDNLGFAGATNHGAALARAPLLLLLNSDVMPQGPKWLARMAALYREHPRTGLLGAKLLYEDGTVQHAGMASTRYPLWQGLWINEHPHKGMAPGALTGTRDVECVTAACAMIDTALYRSLGGLSEDYVIGDFEDSDLCHRARAAGKVNRVALDVTLYHLERQSQTLAGDASWRTGVTLYNCWLHDRRWSEAIAAVGGGAARAAAPAAPRAPARARR